VTEGMGPDRFTPEMQEDYLQHLWYLPPHEFVVKVLGLQLTKTQAILLTGYVKRLVERNEALLIERIRTPSLN